MQNKVWKLMQVETTGTAQQKKIQKEVIRNYNP